MLNVHIVATKPEQESGHFYLCCSLKPDNHKSYLLWWDTLICLLGILYTSQ